MRTARPRPRKVLAVLFACALVLATLSCALAQSPAEGETGHPVLPLQKVVEHLPSWLTHRIGGIAIWQLAAAFLSILAGMVAKKVWDYFLEGRLLPLLEKTRYRFDFLITRAAGKPLGYLCLLGGFAAALSVLPLPATPNVRGFMSGALKVALGALMVWFLFRLVDVAVAYLSRVAERTESKLDDQLLPLINKALKATIVVICGVWVVQLLGYNVSSLLAGLGIGGLAVALALQDTLGNFFGSVFIFLDRPFAVGDWVKVEDVEGTVEKIGFRSTRIRTWPATLVSIPNKTMASAVIDNWSKMPKRRVMQTVGLTYETTADQMEEAVRAMRSIIESDEGVDKEFIVVRFTDFGDSSLNILVYYYTRGITFAEHLETKERINLAIMRALQDMGLSIAFPTRTLYFEGEVARGISRDLSRRGEPQGGTPRPGD